MSKDSLRSRKGQLRKHVQTLLKQLSSHDIAKQSAEITQKVLKSRAFQYTKSMSIFLSMPDGEVSTDAIVEAALAQGKSVFVPYIFRRKAGGAKEMAMLELKDSERPDTLERDAWGIPSLDKDSIATRRNALGGFGIEQSEISDGEVPPLDLIFIPAVAFDRDFRRLGHGKGFYDRYLNQYETCLEARRPRVETPLLIGLALRQQLLPHDQSVPVGDDDWPVDEVVTAGEHDALLDMNL